MSGDGDSDRLSPDDAFATLGNETRLGILQALGRERTSLSRSLATGLALRTRGSSATTWSS